MTAPAPASPSGPRDLRRPLSHRSLGREPCRPGVRRLRRRGHAHLRAVARACHRGGSRSAGPGRSCRGSRARLAAQHAGHAADVLRDQLSRRGLRPHQYRLPRQPPRARGRELRCRGRRGPCRPRLPAAGHPPGPPPAAGRHRYGGRRACARGRGPALGELRVAPRDGGGTAAARAPDRALAHAIRHLHLGNHRTLEGRAVLVPAHVHQSRAGGLALHHRR